MKEEYHHVMHYLYLKGLSAKAAMDEIHKTYDTDYPSYPTAKRIFQSFGNPEILQREIERKESPKKMERIDAIQSILNNDLNPSVRSIAEQTLIPATSVWRTLKSDMGLVFRNPIIAPHVLTSEIREKRVQQSLQLLRVLEKPNLLPHQIITGDESWLEWTARVPGQWQRVDDPPIFSARVSQTIKKTMLIVFFFIQRDTC